MPQEHQGSLSHPTPAPTRVVPQQLENIFNDKPPKVEEEENEEDAEGAPRGRVQLVRWLGGYVRQRTTQDNYSL